MTLSDAEKLASNVVMRDAAYRDNMNELRRIEAISSLLGHGPIAVQHATDLARTLIAVLPVVRAAEEWHDAWGDGADEDDRKLADAVRDMRRALEGK